MSLLQGKALEVPIQVKVEKVKARTYVEVARENCQSLVPQAVHVSC